MNNLYKISQDWKGIDNYTWRHVVSSPEEGTAVICTPDTIKDKDATKLTKKEAQKLADKWNPVREVEYKEFEEYEEYNEELKEMEQKTREVTKTMDTDPTVIDEWVKLPLEKGRWWGKPNDKVKDLGKK